MTITIHIFDSKQSIYSLILQVNYTKILFLHHSIKFRIFSSHLSSNGRAKILKTAGSNKKIRDIKLKKKEKFIYIYIKNH